jgi:hypothetical protein
VLDKHRWWGSDAHSASWLSVDELDSFDYGALAEDRRARVRTEPNSFDGGGLAEPGQGPTMTYRAFLGRGFFEDLA